MKLDIGRNAIASFLAYLDEEFEKDGWDCEILPAVYKLTTDGDQIEATHLRFPLSHPADEYVHWLGHRMADRTDEMALAGSRKLAKGGLYATVFICEAWNLDADGVRQYEARLIAAVDVAGRAYLMERKRGTEEPSWTDEDGITDDPVLDGLRRLCVAASRYLAPDTFDLDALMKLAVMSEDCAQVHIYDPEPS